jgi:hypothetical protein
MAKAQTWTSTVAGARVKGKVKVDLRAAVMEATTATLMAARCDRECL